MAWDALHASLARCDRVVAVWPAEWPLLLGRGAAGPVPGLLLPWKNRRLLKEKTAGGYKQSVALNLDSILDIIGGAMSGSVDADVPLADAGLDSLGAVELRTQLQHATGVDELPSTLLIDHPTARALPRSAPWRECHGRTARGGGRSASWGVGRGVGHGRCAHLHGSDQEHAGAEQAEYISPSLVRLCGKPAAAPAAPPLVIAHSVVGEEQSYERWYKPSNVLEREVIALRHPAFWSGVVVRGVDLHPAALRGVRRRAGRLPGRLALRPDRRLARRAGLAHRVALIARNLGGRPRGLVLIDPPESGAMPGFLRAATCRGHVHISFAMAAESLIIGPTIQLGGARDAGGLEALQGILDEVRGSPEGALAFVLAKASLPASPSIAQAQEATRAAAVRIAVHKQLIQLVWDEWGGRAPKPPRPFAFAGERGEPAILMVRASERGAYFSFLMTQGLRNVDDAVVDRLMGGRSAMVRAAFAKYENASDFRKMLDERSSLAHIRDDFERVLGARAGARRARADVVQIQGSLGEFGPSALELELEGQHFDVVMQCIARRDERFKAMAAEFLAPSPPAKALEELPRSRSTRGAATSGGGGSLKADGWQGALA